MVLKKEPENVHVSHRCMYVPLISEINLEHFLFDYLKEFRWSINASLEQYMYISFLIYSKQINTCNFIRIQQEKNI
jgi:hypothetical protein